MTIEQFKVWVDESFPDNTARLIQEASFRDALKTMADFVFTTNSSGVIQDSINVMNAIKAVVQAAAATAETSKEGAELERQQMLALRMQTALELATYIAQVQILITQGYRIKGNYVISTNTPNLSTIPKADGDAYVVAEDGTTSLPGVSTAVKKGDLLQWNATDGKFTHRPNATIPAPGSVGPEQLASWINFQLMPATSKYAWMIRDQEYRKGLAILKNGGVEGKFILTAAHIVADIVSTAAIQSKAITLSKLADEVTSLIGEPFDNSRSRYLRIIRDLESRLAFALTKEGAIYIPKLETKPGSFKEIYLQDSTRAKLMQPAFKRLNDANLNDVEYISDDLWRGVEIDISTRTSINGACFASFPHKKTPYLKGVNSSGVALQFIQSNNITIRGKRFRGLWNPNTAGVTAGSNYKGFYGAANNDSYPAITGANGDWWLVDGRVFDVNGTWIAGTKVRQGLTIKHGDLITINGSTPVVHSGPGDGYFDFDDFFEVQADGSFGGVNYKAGEFIYFLTNQAQGGPKYPRLMQSKPGEFYLVGSCDPATFAPVNPREGSLWEVTAPGTWAAQGLTVVVGDHIGFTGGAYFVLEGKMKTIPAGKAFYFPCTDAREISVRRQDKGASVGVSAQGQSGAVSQRVIDDIEWLSDSMAGVNGAATKLATLTGRSVTLHSFGGGTSEEEARMLRYLIRNGDTVRGRTLLFTHGQNSGNNLSEIKKVAHEVYHLAGANQRRVLFFTVIGTRNHTFNGTRIVVSNHEDAYGTNGSNGTNFIAQNEQFYKAAYPLQYVNVREVFLAAAAGRTTPDFTFGGMTEEQVATTYHIPPKSFFYENVAKPNKALYTFAGFHSAAGVPTGGTELTVMIRTANGTIGSEIYNIPGTGWMEFADDMTHFSDLGAQVLANHVNNVLLTKNL